MPLIKTKILKQMDYVFSLEQDYQDLDKDIEYIHNQESNEVFGVVAIAALVAVAVGVIIWVIDKITSKSSNTSSSSEKVKRDSKTYEELKLPDINKIVNDVMKELDKSTDEIEKDIQDPNIDKNYHYFKATYSNLENVFRGKRYAVLYAKLEGKAEYDKQYNELYHRYEKSKLISDREKIETFVANLETLLLKIEETQDKQREKEEAERLEREFKEKQEKEEKEKIERQKKSKLMDALMRESAMFTLLIGHLNYPTLKKMVGKYRAAVILNNKERNTVIDEVKRQTEFTSKAIGVFDSGFSTFRFWIKRHTEMIQKHTSVIEGFLKNGSAIPESVNNTTQSISNDSGDMILGSRQLDFNSIVDGVFIGGLYIHNTDDVIKLSDYPMGYDGHLSEEIERLDKEYDSEINAPYLKGFIVFKETIKELNDKKLGDLFYNASNLVQNFNRSIEDMAKDIKETMEELQEASKVYDEFYIKYQQEREGNQQTREEIIEQSKSTIETRTKRLTTLSRVLVGENFLKIKVRTEVAVETYSTFFHNLVRYLQAVNDRIEVENQNRN